jgi:hypothetical protein
MRLKKNILFVINFLFFVIAVKSQSNDECKYISVLTYLRTNVHANEEIKIIFNRFIKKKDKFIEFNLSNRIDFIGIQDFKEDLQSDNFGIDTTLINNARLYRVKYFFDSYRSDFLKKIIQQPMESKLFLTFSKPIDNYLIAELGNFDPDINVTTKFGKGLEMLFKFDSSGLIEAILYRGVTYR